MRDVQTDISEKNNLTKHDSGDSAYSTVKSYHSDLGLASSDQSISKSILELYSNPGAAGQGFRRRKASNASILEQYSNPGAVARSFGERKISLTIY